MIGLKTEYLIKIPILPSYTKGLTTIERASGIHRFISTLRNETSFRRLRRQACFLLSYEESWIIFFKVIVNLAARTLSLA